MAKGSSSVSFVSLSALLHAGVLVALAAIPAVKMIPRLGLDGSEIEVATAAGQGVTEQAVALKSDKTQEAEIAKVNIQGTDVVPKPNVVQSSKIEAGPVKKQGKAKRVIVIQHDLPEKAAVKAEPAIAVDDDGAENSGVEVAALKADQSPEDQADEIQNVQEKLSGIQADTSEERDESNAVVDKAVESAAAEAVDKMERKQEKAEALASPEIKPAVKTLSQIQSSDQATASTAAVASGSDAGEAPALGDTRSYLDLKQMAGNVAPQYPELARRTNQQGEVILQYFVTNLGAVKDLKIVQSSGSNILDAEASRAVSKFRFVPGQEGWASHQVLFSLKGPAAEQASRLRAAGQVPNEK